MNDEKIQKHEEIIKKVYKHMTTFIPEKTIIKNLINLENYEDNEKCIEKIGNINYIDSKYKNEIFNEIFVDEDGFILDVRLSYLKPTDEEIKNMSEYWKILQNTFNRPKPILIHRG